MGKQDKIFQIELERFKMKSSLENKVFYTFLGFLIALILYCIETSQTKENILGLLSVLALFLILGEFLINKYLDKEKVELIKNIDRDSDKKNKNHGEIKLRKKLNKI